MRISKINNIGKNLIGILSILFIIILNTTKVEAYSAIYYDAKFDMGRYRLTLTPRPHTIGANKMGIEDEYVSEWTYGGVEPTQLTRNTDKYHSAMDPVSTEKPYETSSFNCPENYTAHYSAKRDNGIGPKPSSKKNTVPAAYLTYTDGGGILKKHTGLKVDSSRARILESALIGLEDREDKGLSMIVGFNILLEKIETLIGGFEKPEDFFRVVKGLTWLLDKAPSGTSIIFEVAGSKVVSGGDGEPEDGAESEDGESEDAEDSGSEPTNTTDPTKEDFVGNGKNITVTVKGSGPYKRKIIISQEGIGEVYSHNQLYRLETGYEIEGDITADGVATMKITDKGSMSDKGKHTYTTREGSSLVGLRPYDVKWLTLYDLVMDAFIKYNDNVVVQGEGGVSTDNPVAGFIVWVIEGIVDVIEDKIGVAEIEDIVFNTDDREFDGSGLGYELGIFPSGWIEIIKPALSIVSIISLLFLSFAILRVLYLMNLDSMNVSTRLSLKSDTMNIIYTVLGMLLFVTVFYVLAVLNYQITGLIFNSFGDGDVNFFESLVKGNGSGTSILVRLIYLGIKIYITAIYILRALNVAILLVLAPIFIVGTAFLGPDRIKVFLRELIGNIFIQSFHALIILFIVKAKGAMGMVEGGDRLIIALIMTGSIIPLTNTFKDLVFGEGASMIAAGRIAQQAKSNIIGLAAAGTAMAVKAGGTAISVGGKMATKGQYEKFKDFKSRQGDNNSENSNSEAINDIENKDVGNLDSESKIDPAYVDDKLDKKLTKGQATRANIARNINDVMNFIDVIRSGGSQRAWDAYTNDLEKGREFKKYLDANTEGKSGIKDVGITNSKAVDEAQEKSIASNGSITNSEAIDEAQEK